MRRLLLLAALSLAPTACDREAAPPAAAPKRDPHTVVASGGALIDVRSPEEYATKHVDGAKNIPVDEVASRMSEIPRDKPVVVYCHSGGRSAAATRVLRAAGYDVIDIGGMKNW